MKIILLLINITLVIVLSGCSCSGKDAIQEGDYNIAFSVSNQLKLMVNWNAINASPKITGYDLMFGESADKLSLIYHLDTSTSDESRLSYIHSDLIIDGGKRYYYQIKGIQSGAITPPSEVVFYQAIEDLDQDGYIADDCAANIAAINPGAGELCNDQDDNCNNEVDESFTLKGERCSVGDGACNVEGVYGCSERGDTLECFDGDGKPVVAGTGSKELCDGIDNDCDGVSDNGDSLCADYFQHGLGACQEESCVFSGCINGWFDANNDLADGCECQKSNGGVELCDGKDNDCDGVIDNLETLCNNLSNGAGSCLGGKCVISNCDNGYYDINKDGIDGCEYYCVPQNSGVETCDNEDNDCNGFVDDNTDVICSTICEAGVQICLGGVLQACNAREPEAERCDGVDNDCDGTPDNLTTLCSDLPGGSGSCSGGKCVVSRCDDGYYDINKSGSDGCEYNCIPLRPGVESCDNEDNDCNGKVDDNSDIACSNNCGTGWKICKNGVLADCDAPPMSEETCDNKDNDCNGIVDDVVNLDCDSACGTGVRSCINGHWLGCDTPSFKDATVALSQPAQRSQFAFTDHPDSDKIFIFGGVSDQIYRNDLWYFNKGTQLWYLIPGSNAPLPRINSAIAYDYENQKLYLYGGTGEDQLLGDLWVIDITAAFPVWEQLNAATLTPSSGHTLTYGNGVLLLFGGGDETALSGQYALYTIDTASWSIKRIDETMPQSRKGHLSVFQNNRFMIFGGEGASGYLGDFWYFTSNVWEKRSEGEIITPRKNSGYYLGDNDLYVIGGVDENGSLKDLYRFNFTQNRWFLLGRDLEIVPESGFLSYVKDLIQLHFFGGAQGALTQDGYFDLDQNSVVMIEQPDHLIDSAICAFEMDNGFYLFGGERQTGALSNEFWFYNYSVKRWSKISGEVIPSPRKGHQISCVASEGAIYLFGGRDGEQEFQDLWRYDMSSGLWGEVDTTLQEDSAFSGRYGHTFFYHDRYLYLFGGYHDGVVQSDLWKLELRTALWEAVPDQGTKPDMRTHSAVTYVPEYNYLMMFGGVSEDGFHDDFWVLDPESGEWTPYWINKPFGRAYGSLHYHSQAKTILLLGGSGDSPFDDLWELHLGSSNWSYVDGFNNYPDPLFNDQGILFPYQKGAQFYLLYFGGQQATFSPYYITLGCQ